MREENIIEPSFSFFLFHSLACLENIRNRVHRHFGRQEKKEIVFIPQLSDSNDVVKDTYVLSEEVCSIFTLYPLFSFSSYYLC
jgi:hypothetical protein